MEASTGPVTVALLLKLRGRLTQDLEDKLREFFGSDRVLELGYVCSDVDAFLIVRFEGAAVAGMKLLNLHEYVYTDSARKVDLEPELVAAFVLDGEWVCPARAGTAGHVTAFVVVETEPHVDLASVLKKLGGLDGVVGKARVRSRRAIVAKVSVPANEFGTFIRDLQDNDVRTTRSFVELRSGPVRTQKALMAEVIIKALTDRSPVVMPSNTRGLYRAFEALKAKAYVDGTATKITRGPKYDDALTADLADI